MAMAWHPVLILLGGIAQCFPRPDLIYCGVSKAQNIHLKRNTMWKMSPVVSFEAHRSLSNVILRLIDVLTSSRLYLRRRTSYCVGMTDKSYGYHFVISKKFKAIAGPNNWCCWIFAEVRKSIRTHERREFVINSMWNLRCSICLLGLSKKEAFTWSLANGFRWNLSLQNYGSGYWSGLWTGIL